jgi:hypothetical protein
MDHHGNEKGEEQDNRTRPTEPRLYNCVSPLSKVDCDDHEINVLSQIRGKRFDGDFATSHLLLPFEKPRELWEIEQGNPTS